VTAGPAFDAVTFDYWDTLVHAPDPVASKGRRVEWLAAALVRYELEIADVRLREAIDTIAHAAHQNWLDGRSFYAEDASVQLLELLEIEAEAELLDDVIASFNGGDDPPVVDLTPNIAGTLRILRDAGLRIGIVCDVGMAPSTLLRQHLAGHGVLDLFDHWSFSDDVGCYKPAPEIFRHALDGLGGVEPGRAAHVGDLRRTDVAGAQAMGMTAVRYRGSNDDPGQDGDPEGDHVITDHADLPKVLGL
jgi:putative hydrolase of the HAD superfamily